MMRDADLLIVQEEEAGMRLDTFLTARLPDYSRTYFQTLIQEDLVLVNSMIAKKGIKLQAGDEIEVEFSFTPEIHIQPENIPLEILYEDAYLLAINKPVGMVVHPAVGNWHGTFVNALLYHCKNLGALDKIRPGIVHRLDKDTSGVLLAAKDEMTQRKLVEAFAERLIFKEYLAICLGNPGNRRIITKISRHPIRRKEMAVTDTGKDATTFCETLAYDSQISFVRLIPQTGRTHQLRVHMQWIHSPILGDPIYGSLPSNKKYGADRQLLHAHLLRFSHPITQEAIELKAPIPGDMQKFIRILNRFFTKRE
jgi:23S rRNA pseudouridine1911/1915/1917 synthase